jgi:hypothetical protein
MTDIDTVILNAIGDTLDEIGIMQVKLAQRAVLKALSDAGYVVVPREPTEEMITAAINAESGLRLMWDAMIGAFENESS